MSNLEVAKTLISMISDLRANGCDSEEYHEAVAIACGVVLNQEASA